MPAVILLAIDPGYRESHYVVLDSPGPRVMESWSGANEQLLDDLRSNTALRSFLYDHVLIESMDPFGLRLGRETMDTILWIGRFMEAGRAELVPRSLIKMTLCGTRRADDASIRRVLMDRIGKPGTKKEPGPTYGVSGHRWQALAVAVTWLEMHGHYLTPSASQVNRAEEPDLSSKPPGDSLSPGADNRNLFEEEER